MSRNPNSSFSLLAPGATAAPGPGPGPGPSPPGTWTAGSCVGSIAVRPGYVGPEAGRARGPPVTERGGVRTIAREVALFSTLVAAEVRNDTAWSHTATPTIAATTAVAPAAAAADTRFGNGHANRPAADILAVHRLAGLVGVVLVSEDDEGKAGRGPGHPDLDQGTKRLEHLLEVPLGRGVV